MPRKRLPACDLPAKRVTRRSKSDRAGRNGDDSNIPEIYQDMLQEAASSPITQSHDFGRPRKRLKISEDSSHIDDGDVRVKSPDLSLFGSPDIDDSVRSMPVKQIIYDDNLDSEESEVDFEDVDLEPATETEDEEGEPPEQMSLQLDLSEAVKSGPKHIVQRRKPVGRAERDFRLDVHKWHLLCLLLHLQCRNRWCEDEEVQAILKSLVPRKTISLLHVDESKPQYQRSHSFNVGIEEICAIWQCEWGITARGMSRANWKEDLDVSREVDDAEDPIDFEDFREAARLRSGSRDLGAQLFCALLRSVAVDTRLVCSLQVLPFSGSAKIQTPEKPKQNYIYASRQNYGAKSDNSEADASPSNPRWRNSEYSSSAASQPQVPKYSAEKKIRESPYPIFWVEIYSPAATSWIPLDPLVRHTINKPKTGFEPPASDILNSMSYVIAFDENRSAKDVTRRYTQFYNAKTRKTRVESTKGGDRWWARTVGMFRKAALLWEDRDEIENTELKNREASEGMPRNVQDFKGHPIYVLERHLRRNEIIHPKREVGKVNTGTAKGKDGKLETVFRRKDVHVVRSSDQWYRKGKDVKAGEIGLKRAKPKRGPRDIFESEGEDRDNGSMLYAEFQTQVYIPPPVVGGRIPKNAFGNLDVYVSSMIPPGAIHLQHPEAAKAAKLLGIDYADAVTGFSFRGRQGTAVINGIVVAAEFRDAMVEVVQSTEHERVQAQEARKSALILQMWKRFLTFLQIRHKVDQEYGDKEVVAAGSVEDEDGDETYKDKDDEELGGGFMPETMEQDDADTQADGLTSAMAPLPVLLAAPQEVAYHEIIIIESPHNLPKTELSKDSDEHVDSVDDTQEPGGFLMDDQQPSDVQPTEIKAEPDHDAEQGGGLVPEGWEKAPGGFFVDEPETGEVAASGTLLHQGGSILHVHLEGDHHNSDSVDRPEDARPAPSARTSNPPLLRRDSTKDSFLDVSNEDTLSLLSHDPEDDDKDPDWLVDSE